ncbi:MAG TPA: hypothetical protein VF765_03235, partial [Polyangiaceae bacterium]
MVTVLGAAVVAAACGGSEHERAAPEATASTSQAVTTSLSSPSTPIGLAVEVENGVGKPISVRAGQTFYLNQIDLRTFVDASVDEGLAGIEHGGDWASLDWSGIH